MQQLPTRATLNVCLRLHFSGHPERWNCKMGTVAMAENDNSVQLWEDEALSHFRRSAWEGKLLRVTMLD